MILLANYGLNCYETQLLTDQELSSSTFPRCMFVCPSGPVTSPLLDHTNHTFLESLWLPLSTDSLTTHPSPTHSHQAHHMAFWVSHSLLCLVFFYDELADLVVLNYFNDLINSMDMELGQLKKTYQGIRGETEFSFRWIPTTGSSCFSASSTLSSGKIPWTCTGKHTAEAFSSLIKTLFGESWEE